MSRHIPMSGWVGLGGQPLEGDAVTRFAFVDDAGVAPTDPRFVVAGILMHRDRQTASIESRLDDIVADLHPTKTDLVLHASDLWHGTKAFHRTVYPDSDARRAVVARIASIVPDLGLTVVMGQAVRDQLGSLPDDTTKDGRELREAAPHVLAQFACCIMIEKWMRTYAASEVAQVIHEDMPRSKKTLRQFNVWARHPVLGPYMSPHLGAITHIKGPVYYADKTEEKILQLADTCAFVICRHLNGSGDVGEIFASLKPWIFQWDVSAGS